jgi:rod shape determining protein RodA
MSFGRNRGLKELPSLKDVRPARRFGYRRLDPVLPQGRAGAPATVSAAFRHRGLWQRAWAKDSTLRHVDWVLVLIVLGLSLIGTLLIWSATAPGLAQSGASTHTYLDKQLLVVVIGLIFMTGVTMLDYRVLKIIAPFAYAAGCLGLLAVLSPLGTTILGSHSWIPLPGGFQIEPSEYAKLGLILMIGLIFGTALDRSPRPGIRELGLALACALPVIGLILAEPDLGVVVVLVVITGGMIALSGVRLRWLAALTAAATLAVIAVLKLHLLKAYQAGRLTSFLHPSANALGSGYQAAQAKIAIGSGGMFGQGLFHGKLTAGSFLGSYQFQGTDFIFAVAGEEIGFAGCVTIVVLLGLLIFRAVRIAARADDMFGLLVASGIAIWFAVQSFINMAMTVGILPVTGIPLPFVSYGGSALFADMIAVGLLQSIHRRHKVFT